MATPIRNTDMLIRPTGMGMVWTRATNAARHSPVPPLVPPSAALSPQADITRPLVLPLVPFLEPLLAVPLDQVAAEGLDGYRAGSILRGFHWQASPMQDPANDNWPHSNEQSARHFPQSRIERVPPSKGQREFLRGANSMPHVKVLASGACRVESDAAYFLKRASEERTAALHAR